MDKLANYRQAIRQLLSRYAGGTTHTSEIKVELVFDDERGHYQWMDVGWKGTVRVYRCVVHFDIQDGKVWLQQNLTDQNPAEDLVELGVAREDIVLGLQPPYKRPYTDYGVA
ncbi:MAG: XisI protein [Cyanobacteria bacterium J06634_6]